MRLRALATLAVLVLLSLSLAKLSAAHYEKRVVVGTIFGERGAWETSLDIVATEHGLFLLGEAGTTPVLALLTPRGEVVRAASVVVELSGASLDAMRLLAVGSDLVVLGRIYSWSPPWIAAPRSKASETVLSPSTLNGVAILVVDDDLRRVDKLLVVPGNGFPIAGTVCGGKLVVLLESYAGAELLSVDTGSWRVEKLVELSVPSAPVPPRPMDIACAGKSVLVLLSAWRRSYLAVLDANLRIEKVLEVLKEGGGLSLSRLATWRDLVLLLGLDPDTGSTVVVALRATDWRPAWALEVSAPIWSSWIESAAVVGNELAVLSGSQLMILDLVNESVEYVANAMDTNWGISAVSGAERMYLAGYYEARTAGYQATDSDFLVLWAPTAFLKKVPWRSSSLSAVVEPVAGSERSTTAVARRVGAALAPYPIDEARAVTATVSFDVLERSGRMVLVSSLGDEIDLSAYPPGLSLVKGRVVYGYLLKTAGLQVFSPLPVASYEVRSNVLRIELRGKPLIAVDSGGQRIAAVSVNGTELCGSVPSCSKLVNATSGLLEFDPTQVEIVLSTLSAAKSSRGGEGALGGELLPGPSIASATLTALLIAAALLALSRSAKGARQR